MFSISTLPGIGDVGRIADNHDIQIETTSLIFIGDYPDKKLEELKNDIKISRFHSAHGPFFDLMPCTSDEEFKDLILRRFQKTIEWCEKLKIENIIFHSGWIPKTYPDEIWIRNSYSFWTQLLENVNPGINIYLENIYENHPILIKELIDQVQYKNFKVCLDIGHVNANSTNGLELWVKELGSRIGHLHIHNNNGETDDHYGLTKGTLKFPETFELLKNYCPEAYWNLEIKTDIEESIIITKKHL